jgi:hypothetical protein
MPLPIPSPIQEAAAAIVALINSSPRSPRQDEIEAIIARDVIEAIIARIGSVPAQAAPISDLRIRLRKAMAKADAALDASCKLLDGPEFATAEAELSTWNDEIAAMESEIPNPPRCFEDLVARAEIARHGGDVVDGKLMEAEDEEDVFLGPAARLIEAVLKYRGADRLAMSPAHATHHREWRALIDQHRMQFGSVDEAMPPEAAKAEEKRLADHLDMIDELAARIFTEPARTWGDVLLYAQACFWAHWSGVDPEGAAAPAQLAAGPMSHGAAPDKALAKLLLAIFSVAGVGPLGKPCGVRP